MVKAITIRGSHIHLQFPERPIVQHQQTRVAIYLQPRAGNGDARSTVLCVVVDAQPVSAGHSAGAPRQLTALELIAQRASANLPGTCTGFFRDCSSDSREPAEPCLAVGAVCDDGQGSCRLRLQSRHRSSFRISSNTSSSNTSSLPTNRDTSTWPSSKIEISTRSPTTVAVISIVSGRYLPIK